MDADVGIKQSMLAWMSNAIQKIASFPIAVARPPPQKNLRLSASICG